MATDTDTSSYETATGWRAYQPFFRPEMRLEPGNLPAEEWWPWGGLRVHLDRYAANGSAKVIVLHGGGGYSRLLSPLAVALRALGHEVVAPDMPGYGLTRPPPKGNTWELWVHLVADLVEREQAQDARPLVLFGASLGGPLALQAAARADVRGVIATMLLDPRDPRSRAALAPPWALPIATRLMLASPRMADELRLPIALVSNMAAIANDPKLVRVIRKDRLGGGAWIPLGFLKSFLTADPPVPAAEFDRCPVLLVHPGDDRWTPLEHSRRVFDQLPAEKELVVLENCGHFPLEEPGLSQMGVALERFLRRL
jgi:alpha-beta hydrolase superfamily lysophospholipase